MGALENIIVSKWAVAKISLGTPVLKGSPKMKEDIGVRNSTCHIAGPQRSLDSSTGQ